MITAHSFRTMFVMVLKYKLRRCIMLSSVLVLSLFVNVQARQSPQKKVGFQNPTLLVTLDSLDVYSSFYADDNHLVWKNYTRNQLYFYNLNTDEQHHIQLREGRGPGEMLSAIDLIVADGFVYLLDLNLMKVVKINIETEGATDIRLDSGPHGRFRNIGDDFYFWNITSPNAVVNHYNFRENKSQPVDHSGLDLLKNLLGSFDRSGYLRANGNKLYFVTKYVPDIYIFDAAEKRFEQKVSYDEVRVERESRVKTDNGAIISRPPSKVEVLLHNFTTISQKPNSLFILSQGKTKTRRYEQNKLYEFDVKAKEMFKIHDLGISASTLVANDESLFVYSQDEGKIYRYSIATYQD